VKFYLFRPCTASFSATWWKKRGIVVAWNRGIVDRALLIFEAAKS
jgi:hypothetical protein